MGEYHVYGGKRLFGELAIVGGKNAALPILAAAVLGKKSIIHNCPKISDTFCTMEILTKLGCDVNFEGRTAVVDTGGLDTFVLPQEYMAKMRSSIIFAGGLLGRFGQAIISPPGGCKLGERPIALHLDAFQQLGAKIWTKDGLIHIKASRLEGAKIPLSFPSVGATQNAMLAAVLARGTTVIKNAAKEPEIVDLQDFLNTMGAKVSGAGSSCLIIEGVKELQDAEYTIMPDRIVAGTYLTAATITGGEIRLTDVPNKGIRPITDLLKETGAQIWEEDNSITLSAKGRPRALRQVVTGPHPAFPTDMQPQLTALLATADGSSFINERVFESRDKHIGQLRIMGANISNRDKQNFHILGVNQLQGATVRAHDLRSGAALILAGLGAEGETVVQDCTHIRRGYEAIDKDLRVLGAEIKAES